MLLQLRNLTRGWIAYVLLALLAVAFAIWGVNDVFSGVGAQNLAEVGDRKITPAQLTRELDLTLRGQRQQGVNVTRQEAIEAGYHQRALQAMITRLALAEYAERIGVSASDAQVAERIRSIPAATNPVTGNFDAAAYNRFLAEIGYTPPEFEEEIRIESTAPLLTGPMSAGVRAPSSFGALLLAFETETRTISMAEAPAAAVGQVAPPTEAQLQAFYEESREQLRLPEFRALSLIYARPEDFVARVQVPEERLRAEFEARREALTRPERRTYVRVLAQNEAQANDIKARLDRGENAAAIARALGVQSTPGENQARSEVPDAPVAAAVFEMRPGGPARVVRGELAPWVVVRVESSTPAVAPEFSAIREELRAAIAADSAQDLLGEAVNAFEQARDEGLAPVEAARRAGLPVVAVPAVEAGGRNPQGEQVEAIGDPDVLATAFETPEGEASDFIAAQSADVIVVVDRITPSSVRPLAEVRGDLSRVWVVQERARRLRELGQRVTAAVEGGQSLAEAASANGMRVIANSVAIPRQAAGERLSRSIAGQVFNAAPGSTVSAIRDDGAAVQVAVVERVDRANPAEMPREVEQLRLQMGRSLSESVAEAVQAQIVERVRIRRNDELLRQTYTPNSDGENADAAQ